MKSPIEERLQHYLDRIAAGESVDALLPEIEAENGAEGAELARLVALSARAMRALPHPMRPDRRETMHAELQAAFARERRAGESRAKALAARRPGFFGALWRPVPRLAALALALLLLGTTGVVVRAEDSMPGDALYSVKRVAENARLAITVDPLRRAELHLRLADRRFDELQRLADRGGAIDAGLIDALLAQHRAVLAETGRTDDPELARAARDRVSAHQEAIEDLVSRIDDPVLRRKAEEVVIDLGEIQERLPTAIARPSEGVWDGRSRPVAASPEPTLPKPRGSRATPTLGRARATLRALPTPSLAPAMPTAAAGGLEPRPGPSILPPGSTPPPPVAEPPGNIMTALPGTPIVRPPRPARETAEAARRATQQAIIHKATRRAERKATEKARIIRGTEQAERRATEEARHREAAEATRRAHQATREALATATRSDRRPTPTPEQNDLTPQPSATDEPPASATP